jgi:hypothetical protein
MYARIKPWIVRNQHRISWCIIGMMIMSMVDYLARGDYANAALCAFIAITNYIMDRTELI